MHQKTKFTLKIYLNYFIIVNIIVSMIYAQNNNYIQLLPIISLKNTALSLTNIAYQIQQHTIISIIQSAQSFKMQQHESTLEIEQFNSDTDTIIAVGRHYGQLLPLCFDKKGQPRHMLGPHYLIFLATFIVALIGQVAVLVYLYFFVVWYYLLACIAMTIFFCYMYIKVGFSVPGVASSGMEPDYETKLNSRYCVPCKIIRQTGTKHCYQCDVCIYQLDHHCPWVGKCVGRDNICQFKLFLLSVMLGLSVYGAVLFMAVNVKGK